MDSWCPALVPAFVPKVTRKQEGMANSGQWHFVAGDYLAWADPGWVSSHADTRSLPHKEASAVSKLPGPEQKLSALPAPATPLPECQLPWVAFFFYAPGGASVKVNSLI